MKKIIKGLLFFGAGVGVLTAGLYLATLSLPLGLILAATGVVPITKSSEEFRGNGIKDSIFSVSKNGNIEQSALAHPIKLLSIIKEKDKNKVFQEETLNMFSQLKDENITYRTRSHALTLKYLRTLKRAGLIEDLKYKPVKKSRLLMEKLLIGNIKGMFSREKSTIFDIAFKLTKGKKRDKNELMKLLMFQSSIKEDDKKETSIKEEPNEIIEKKDNQSKQEEILGVRKETVIADNVPREEMPEDRKIELEAMLDDAYNSNEENTNERQL